MVAYALMNIDTLLMSNQQIINDAVNKESREESKVGVLSPVTYQTLHKNLKMPANKHSCWATTKSPVRWKYHISNKKSTC